MTNKIKRCLICTPVERSGNGGVYYWDEEDLPIGENQKRSGWEVHAAGIHPEMPHPPEVKKEKAQKA